MNKLTLLVALFIALIAVTSATVTFKASTDPEMKYTLGVAYDFVFTTDAELAEAAVSQVTFTDELLMGVGISGQGSNHFWCTVGDVNAAYYTLGGKNMAITVVSTIAAAAEIKCPVRIAASPKQKIKDTMEIQVDGGAKTELKLAAALADGAISATASGSKVTFSINGLPANSFVGPLSFFYTWDATDAAGDWGYPVIRSQFWAAGFSSDLGGGFRLFAPNADEVWIVSGASPTTATFDVTFPEASTIAQDKAVGKNIKYIMKSDREADLKTFEATANGDVIPKFERVATAQVNGDDGNKKITFQFNMPFSRMDKPVLKVKFDTELSVKDVIFAADSAFVYQIAGGAAVPLAYNEALEWTLDTVVASTDKVVTVSGSFKVGTADFSGFAVSFDCDGWTAEDKLRPRVKYSDVKVTEASNALLKFNFKISFDDLYKKFTNVEVDTFANFIYQVDNDAEIRANGEFYPSCTVDGLDISTSDGVSSGVDNTGLAYAKISGTFSDAGKNAIVSCEHKLNGGKKGNDKVKVTVYNLVNKSNPQSENFSASWDKVGLIEQKDNFDQQVIVYAAQVTTASAFADVVAKAKVAVGADNVDGEFRILTGAGAQEYANADVALAPKFATPVAAYAEPASKFIFVYKTKDGKPVTKNIIKDGVEYDLSLASGGDKAFDAIAYINGNDDASFGPAQVVVQGRGFQCWSSQQCFGADVYCYDNTCTHYSQLSADAQTQVNKNFNPDDTSAASYASAAFACVVIALALFF